MQNCNDTRIDTAFLKVRVFADSVEKNRKAKTTCKSGMPFRIVYNLRDRRIILKKLTVPGEVEYTLRARN